MKRFVLKKGLFIALLATCLVVVNCLYVKSGTYKERQARKETTKFKEIPDDLSVVNFGSSHGQYALDYEGTGVGGFNFALSYQDFYYDLQIAKHYKNHLSRGAVVLIPVSFFSFGTDQENDPNSSYHSRYYGLLPYKRIIGHNVFEYFKRVYCPILLRGDELILKKDDPEAFMLIARNKHSRARLEELGELAAAQDRDRIDPSQALLRKNTRCLRELIAFCSSRGWKPLLITTPFSDYYIKHFTESSLDSFRTRVLKVSEEYSVPYLDYSRDPRFLWNPSLFADTTHLNTIGRAEFTRIVLDYLENAGYLVDRTN